MKPFFEQIRSIDKASNEKSLRLAIKEGSAFSAMMGFGETYVSAFAVALKATNTQLGVLGSLPQLLSSITQILSVRKLERVRERKKVMLPAILLQAFTWLPLFLLPIFFDSVWLLVLMFTLYFSLGTFSKSSWDSMMGDLVAENERGAYFGNRNKISGAVAFVSVLMGGLILHFFSEVNIWFAFGILFLVAFVARLFSYYYITKMYEPSYIIKRTEQLGLFRFIKEVRESVFGKFVLFNGLLLFMVYVCSPFFTVYMLRDLGFSYLQYTILTMIATFVTFLTMLYWGKHADRFGNKKILTINAILISAVPILWVFSGSFYYIFILQLIAGFAWAGFKLSSANFVFDAVEADKRAHGSAYYNLFNGICMFLGAMVGTVLLLFLPTPEFLVSSIQILFVISGLGRALVVLGHAPALKELRKVEEVTTRRLFVQLVAVRPISGLIFKPMVGMDKTVKRVRTHISRLDFHSRIRRFIKRK